MDAFLTDSHLDTKIKRCAVLNMILVPKLECAGREGCKTAENSTHDSSYKKRVCSSPTSITVLRAELGMYPLNSNRDMRKLK